MLTLRRAKIIWQPWSQSDSSGNLLKHSWDEKNGLVHFTASTLTLIKVKQLNIFDKTTTTTWHKNLCTVGIWITNIWIRKHLNNELSLVWYSGVWYSNGGLNNGLNSARYSNGNQITDHSVKGQLSTIYKFVVNLPI